MTSVRCCLCLSHSKPHRYDSHFLSAFFSGRSHDVPWSARHVRYIQPYPWRRGFDFAQYLLTSTRHDARVPHTSPRLRSVRRSQCVLMHNYTNSNISNTPYFHCYEALCFVLVVFRCSSSDVSHGTSWNCTDPGFSRSSTFGNIANNKINVKKCSLCTLPHTVSAVNVLHCWFCL